MCNIKSHNNKIVKRKERMRTHVQKKAKKSK